MRYKVCASKPVRFTVGFKAGVFASMNREQPVASITLHAKTEAKKYAQHIDRLRKIKPSIDNRAPREHVDHVGAASGKKMKQKNERRFEIEYENALLLDKMRRIIKLGTVMSNSGILTYAHPPLQSLNAGQRRRDLERINRENMGIVQRIQASHSSYEVAKWDKQRKEEIVMLKRLARKPRAIDNSNLLETSGISYTGKDVSPGRPRAPRHLPPLSPARLNSQASPLPMLMPDTQLEPGSHPGAFPLGAWEPAVAGAAEERETATEDAPARMAQVKPRGGAAAEVAEAAAAGEAADAEAGASAAAAGLGQTAGRAERGESQAADEAADEAKNGAEAAVAQHAAGSEVPADEADVSAAAGAADPASDAASDDVDAV